MLSLNLKARKPLNERLLAQAIKANKISQDEFDRIVEVFRDRAISISNFWNYVRDRKMEEGASGPAVGDAIASVLSDVERFNNLIEKDIKWDD